MKKFRNLLLVVFVALLTVTAFTLTACKARGDDSKHTHTYSSQWTYDESYHWHKATCEHTAEINGRAAHSFDGNECSVCHYKKTGTDNPDNPQKVYKTVSFNLNGGNGSLDDMQFSVGEVMSALPSPTRDGYTFVCWEIPFIGEEYTSASVMPNRDLQLSARWEKNIDGYSDQYVSFKPASQGYKSTLIYDMYRKDVDKFVYVEITSDDLNGKVGENNNFNLRTIEGMEYKVGLGYNWAWYQGSFNNPNGAQRFTLNYGSNIQFVTISDNSGVVQQTYLLDIYVKHDYYISLYKNIFEEEPYDKIRVIENDRFSADTKINESNKFEFDSRVYFNNETRTYEKFVYSTAITKNWSLYQTYKPVTIAAELNEGILEEDLIITPYTQYFTLPSAEKDGYDFLGWQDENGDYLTNVQGYSGINYISEENKPEKLTAIYAEKKYYYTFENDILNTYKTVPIVTYTDKTMRTILDIEYTPYNTDCVLPIKTVQGQGEVFIGWQYYYVSDKNEFSKNLSSYDFDSKITTPLALVPIVEKTSDYVVPLNGDITSRETGTYRMYLPANQRYQLSISATNSVTLTINQYGSTSNSKTLTVKSSSPQTVNLDYYIYNLGSTVYSHGYVTFKVTSLSGSFTAKLVGATAGTSGSHIVTDDNNTASVGEDYTVSLVKPGYAFDGWYEDDIKLSENEFITMQDREMEITAKWVVCPITLEKSIADAGTVSGVSGTTAIGEEATITAVTKNGYTWVGWYNGNTLLTKEQEYTFTMPSEPATYTAKWIKITVDRNLTSAGSVTALSKTYFVGDEATITATTNNGYTFVGWYNENVELTKDLSYTFEMPAESATYTAKWAKLTLARNNSSAGSISTLNSKYTAGQEVTITANTYSGYTFLGWYNGDTLLSANANYTFEMPAENVTYTATWTSYTLTTTRNDSNAGTVTTKNAVKTTAGQEVTITANTNSGYTFLGWYHGDTLLSINANYTFEMPAESVTYTATWTSYTLTTARNDNDAGTVTTKNAVKTTAGQEVTVVATTNNGYTFEGWYNGDILLSKDANYTFNMPTENVTYTAKWTSYTLSVITTVGGSVNPSAKNQVIISFNLNGASGTTPESQNITKTNAFSYCHNLKSITIPKSVTNFGSQAFFSGPGTGDVYYLGSLANWCGITFNSYSEANPVSRMHNLYINGELLTELEIPSSITTIKSFAFYGCSNLRSVVLHSNVKTIYTDAFRNCYNMIEVYNYSSLSITKGSTSNGYVGYYALGVYNSNEEQSRIFTTEEGLKFYVDEDICYLIDYVGDESNLILPDTFNGRQYQIKDHVFAANANLVSVKIPEGVLKIEDSTFSGCVNLKKVDLPTSITAIGNSAFSGCINLEEIFIPNNVSTIGTYAFNHCKKLRTINLPTGLSNDYNAIGNNAFYGCYMLTEIYNLSSKNVSVGTNGQTVGIGGNSLGYALTVYSSLNEDSRLVEYNDYIFYVSDEQCYLVGYIGTETTLSLPQTINGRYYDIKKYAFAEQSTIIKVIIPNGVKEIGAGAFSECNNLEEIVLPDSIEIIYSGAFDDCTSLTKVDYLGDISKWCAITFQPSGNSNPLSMAHNLYLNGNFVTQIEIPSSISQIKSGAFYGWSSLKSIKLPSNLTRINSQAFYGCSGLTSITIPESVTTIDSQAFYGCSGLTSITIPESVTSIGSYAFHGCDKLQYNSYNNANYLGNESNPYLVLVKAKNTSISSCTINSSTKFILGNAFYNCSKLTTISIPYSVTFIGSNAFRGSGLTSATFSNRSGWKAGGTSLTLSNTTTNATYLISTYDYLDWNRT